MQSLSDVAGDSHHCDGSGGSDLAEAEGLDVRLDVAVVAWSWWNCFIGQVSRTYLRKLTPTALLSLSVSSSLSS